MNITQDKKKFKFPKMPKLLSRSFLLGGSDRDNDTLHVFTLSLTIGVWLGATAIGSIIFLLGATDLVFTATVVRALTLGSVVGFGVTLISTMASNDFDRTYGWGIWWRIVIINFLMFTAMMTVDSGVTTEDKREKVKALEFIITDIKDCKYLVRMTSDTMSYDYCSDYDTEYDRMKEAKNITANLIGKDVYGNQASHVEFLSKRVILK